MQQICMLHFCISPTQGACPCQQLARSQTRCSLLMEIMHDPSAVNDESVVVLVDVVTSVAIMLIRWRCPEGDSGPTPMEAETRKRRFFSFMCILFMVHSTAIGLFRAMGAIGRSLVIAYTIAWLLFIMLILLGGFVIVKSALPATVHAARGGWPDANNVCHVDRLHLYVWQSPAKPDPTQPHAQKLSCQAVHLSGLPRQLALCCTRSNWELQLHFQSLLCTYCGSRLRHQSPA